MRRHKYGNGGGGLEADSGFPKFLNNLQAAFPNVEKLRCVTGGGRIDASGDVSISARSHPV
jgi:hypothetical protein